MIETANKSDTEELMKLMKFYRENTISVNRITNGIDDKLRQDFITELGSKLLKLKN